MSIEDLQRILAIDFGLKRIGLALTDPLRTFAYPFETISNDNKVYIVLARFIEEKGIAEIVLGVPMNDFGEPDKLAPRILNFKKQLEKRFGLDVHLRDERYSSEMAKQRIIESTPKKKSRRDKGLVDRNAAALILEDYLREIVED